MPKLHELLAVEKNLENQAAKTRTELEATFEKKRSHFSEIRKTYSAYTEGAPVKIEEVSEIQTTVKDELLWWSAFQIKSIDLSHQVDVANTQARADVVDDDGNTILKDVPATSLLQLEKRLKEVQVLLTAIPTLDPTKGFKQDDNRSVGIYQARDVESERKTLVKKPLVLYPATDKHPAQCQILEETIATGLLRTQEWSSMLTPVMKASLLERVENLSRFVKKARARANEQDIDVSSSKIGKKLMDYILVPLA